MHTNSSLLPKQSHVQAKVHENGCLELVLNRPKKYHTLSHEMIAQITTNLKKHFSNESVSFVLIRPKFDSSMKKKVFSVGGDIKQLTSAILGTQNYTPQDFVSQEYIMDQLIYRYPKPIISIIDGLAMGGGAGLGLNAYFRVFTSNTRIAMPECKIGWIPDTGCTHWFTQMPWPLDIYLGLTGNRINGIDGVKVGLGTHYCPDSLLERLVSRLVDDPLNASHYTQYSHSSLHYNNEIEKKPSKKMKKKRIFAYLNNFLHQMSDPYYLPVKNRRSLFFATLRDHIGHPLFLKLKNIFQNTKAHDLLFLIDPIDPQSLFYYVIPITYCFSCDSLSQILSRLNQVFQKSIQVPYAKVITPTMAHLYSTWASKCIKLIQMYSPLSLQLTLYSLTRGRNLKCFESRIGLEFTIVSHLSKLVDRTKYGSCGDSVFKLFRKPLKPGPNMTNKSSSTQLIVHNSYKVSNEQHHPVLPINQSTPLTNNFAEGTRALLLHRTNDPNWLFCSIPDVEKSSLWMDFVIPDNHKLNFYLNKKGHRNILHVFHQPQSQIKQSVKQMASQLRIDIKKAQLSPGTRITLNNGVSIPIFGLGTWKLVGNKCIDCVNYALHHGYRYIDTAAFYKNHSDIAQILNNLPLGLRRHDIFLVDKIWTEDFGYQSTLDAVDRSLKELGVDFIDLMLIHFPAKKGISRFNKGALQRYRAETWKALEECYSLGKVRAIGVSNYTIPHLKELLSYCRIKPVVNQIEAHPFLTQIPLRFFCHSNNITVIGYSPLAHGRVFSNDTLISISNKYNISVSQVALIWMLQSNMICIPKSSSLTRIFENSQIFKTQLNDLTMDRIDDLNQNLHTCWNPENVS